MYQGGSGSEAHGQSALACSKTETEGDMGLAGAGVAESDDVVVALDVLAAGQPDISQIEFSAFINASFEDNTDYMTTA